MSATEMIAAYLIGLASGATPAGLGRVREFWSVRRPLRRFWEACLQGETLAIIASLKHVIDKDSTSAGMYDSLALGEIKTLLSKSIKVELPIYMSKYPPSEKLNQNIVLFGGTISNAVTYRFLKATKTALSFEGHKIHDKNTNEDFEPEYDKNELCKDYGIVMRVPNPYNTSKKFFLFAGCYDYGTYFGAKIATDPKSVQRILKDTHDDDFELIVCGEVFERRCQTAEIVRVHRRS
jgi:hypothetical protein